MCAGKRMALVSVLGNHAASAEWKGATSGFRTAQELVRSGW